MISDKLNTGRWYNKIGHSEGLLLQQYGTPGGWFRRSYYNTLAKNDSDDIRLAYDTIRAAAIFKRSTPLTPLSVEPAYTLVCDFDHKDWKIMLVSTANPHAWLTRAYEAGAVAWWLCEPGPVFKYEPIQHPDPREESLTAQAGVPGPIAQGPGNYDRELVLQDLLAGKMSQQVIANKYGISRNTVNSILRRHKIHTKIIQEGRPLVTKKRLVYPQEKVPAIITDIVSGQYTKLMIAQRHDVTEAVITNIINKNNLVGHLPRGYNATVLSPKRL